MVKEIKTVLDSEGIAVLEIVKEDDKLVVYEADDMDRQISFPAAVIPMLINLLETLK